jgi:FixJ family two-component response regulator
MDDAIVIVIGVNARSRRATMGLLPQEIAARAYSSLDEFLAAGEVERAGCVLLDCGACHPVEMLQRLVKCAPRIPAVVLCESADVNVAVAAMRTGAMNYLVSPCDADALRAAVVEALECDAERRRRLATCVRSARRLARITPAEREVLDLIVAGCTNREMADRLGMSVRCIEVRRANLMKKTAARSVAELVKLVLAAETSS